MNYKLTIKLLLSMMVIGLAGCANQGGGAGGAKNEDYTNNPRTGTITEETFNHKVEGTTHELHSKENKTLFARVGQACYFNIYTDSSNINARTGAIHLKKHLSLALGINTIEIKDASGHTYDENEKAIYIGCSEQFVASGLTSAIDVGKTGYTIKSKKDNVFVNAIEYEAYSLGVNRLLELLLGYDYYMNDFVTYEKAEKQTDLYSYDFDDAEIPDYQYRKSAGYNTAEYNYSSGCTSTGIIHKTEYPWIHNAYSLLGDYHEEHPEWFDDTPGFRPDDPNKQVFQLCYTAHGDPESLQLMVEKGAEKIISVLTENPGNKIISITAEDTNAYCKCPTCLESIAKYKTEAGTIVQYINRVDDIVNAYFRNDGSYHGGTPRASLETFPTDYDYTIFFFAYHNTVTAPANVNEKGEFVPIDDKVITNEHVGVMMAPSNGKYIYSFYDERNKGVADNIRAWAKCTKRFLAYLYSDNWRGYTYPYNSFSADVENMKFFKELNAIWVFDSCGGENPWLPGFQEFKKYLINKAMINVNCDVDSLAKKFFRNVYGDAADTMYALYHSERSYCLSIADVYVGNINDNTMFEGESGAARWPAGMLLSWWNECDKAMKQLELIKLTDPDRYEMYRMAILLESIFPRFAMLDLHGSFYDEVTFHNLAKQLKADMLELKFTYVKEHGNGLLTLWFDSWGV